MLFRSEQRGDGLVYLVPQPDQDPEDDDQVANGEVPPEARAEVLRHLTDMPTPAGDIAKAAGLEPATCRQILGLLVEEGEAEKFGRRFQLRTPF